MSVAIASSLEKMALEAELTIAALKRRAARRRALEIEAVRPVQPIIETVEQMPGPMKARPADEPPKGTEGGPTLETAGQPEGTIARPDPASVLRDDDRVRNSRDAAPAIEVPKPEVPPRDGPVMREPVLVEPSREIEPLQAPPERLPANEPPAPHGVAPDERIDGSDEMPDDSGDSALRSAPGMFVRLKMFLRRLLG